MSAPASATDLAVIVLAAGAGTRMKSVLAKPLHHVAGLPMLQHVLRTAQALEPARLVTVVRHEREQLIGASQTFAPEVIIADQDEIPGTGRAVEQGLAAITDFEGSVVVLSGDVPMITPEALRELIAEHERAGNAMTVLSTYLPDPGGFGRILRNRGGSFERIVEHKDASEAERAVNEINGGIYVFRADLLREALSAIGTDNAQGEKYLTDVAGVLQGSGHRIEAFPTADPWLVAGVNDRVQLAEVGAEWNRRIIRQWQLSGVSVHDPASTWIDIDVQIEPDVELLPGTRLHGATRIASDAVIGPDTTLTDTVVGVSARVNRTEAMEAEIGPGATVGPWSYLRPGAKVGEDGKVGTFVEVKNSVIGDRAKVPHLSYIGDAEVGEGANVGAGAITANYDGVNKHRTHIGAHARTGSHTVFVAPVTVGDGAYTGAGSVIRKDVSPGALAMNVAPQRERPGWVAEHRPGSAAAEAAESATDE